jgi:hypothetical protein
MTMTLASRLSRLEAALVDDGRPALVVAFEDDDGRLVDAGGGALDPDVLGPRTLLIVLTTRDDGPQ